MVVFSVSLQKNHSKLRMRTELKEGLQIKSNIDKHLVIHDM